MDDCWNKQGQVSRGDRQSGKVRRCFFSSYRATQLKIRFLRLFLWVLNPGLDADVAVRLRVPKACNCCASWPWPWPVRQAHRSPAGFGSWLEAGLKPMPCHASLLALAEHQAVMLGRVLEGRPCHAPPSAYGVNWPNSPQHRSLVVPVNCRAWP